MYVFVSRTERRRHRPGRGQVSVDSTLRAQARKLMQAGKLPNRPPDRMFGGPGVGTPCAVCGASVEQDEAELEIEWDDGTSANTYHLHARCFAALDLELREHELTRRTLAVSGQLESGPTALSADKPREAT
jgi:hypothetical protein